MTFSKTLEYKHNTVTSEKLATKNIQQFFFYKNCDVYFPPTYNVNYKISSVNI